MLLWHRMDFEILLLICNLCAHVPITVLFHSDSRLDWADVGNDPELYRFPRDDNFMRPVSRPDAVYASGKVSFNHAFTAGYLLAVELQGSVGGGTPILH